MDKFLKPHCVFESSGTASNSANPNISVCDVQHINLNFQENSDSSTVTDVSTGASSKPKPAFNFCIAAPSIPKVDKKQNSERLVKQPIAVEDTDSDDDYEDDSDDEETPEMSLSEMGINDDDLPDFENLQPEKSNLYEGIMYMINNNIAPNVQIRIGQINFNCHMIVLQAYSTFFMQFTNELLIELPGEKVTPQAFTMLYTWMLAEDPIVQRPGIVELFVAARFLQVDGLVKQCWFCFSDELCYQEDEAFRLYLEAIPFNLPDLEQLMLMRICKFFLSIVASKDFLLLSKKSVCQLLSSNTIGIHSEIEILMAAVRWLSHDWDNRKEFLIEVADCIRFSLMPSWYLVRLTKDSMALEIHRLVKHPHVAKMISDGILFLGATMHYSQDDEDFRGFLESMCLKTPTPRQLVCDKLCNYHYCGFSLNMASATYSIFKDYMVKIRDIGAEHWRNVQLAKDLLGSPSFLPNIDNPELPIRNIFG